MGDLGGRAPWNRSPGTRLAGWSRSRRGEGGLTITGWEDFRALRAAFDNLAITRGIMGSRTTM